MSHGRSHPTSNCGLQAAVECVLRAGGLLAGGRLVGKRQQGVHERTLSGREQHLDHGIIAGIARPV